MATLTFDMKLEKESAPIKAELRGIKLMTGVLIAIAVSDFVKQFF